MFSYLKNILTGFSYTYIFIDESICEQAGLATLTAIFIPQYKLNKISIDFFKISKEIVDKFQSTNKGPKILYPFPLLHGKSLLSDPKDNPDFDLSLIDDDFRIYIMDRIIDLALNHKLLIVRLGYNNFIEIKKAGFKDDKMYSTNWLNLSRFIDKYLYTKSAICVMDGNDIKMINTFSRFISMSKALIYLHQEEESSIFKNGKRFINNVFYVPSKYSEHLQIVDIISYILHKKDYIDITGNRSPYSNCIFELYPRLLTKRLINHVVHFNYRTDKNKA
jgi:hypothetical protein